MGIEREKLRSDGAPVVPVNLGRKKERRLT